MYSTEMKYITVVFVDVDRPLLEALHKLIQYESQLFAILKDGVNITHIKYSVAHDRQ